MVLTLGADRAELAQDRMRPYIDKARLAADEGRIADVTPLMATQNMDESKITEGWFFLEIRFRPLVNGEKGPRQSYVVPVLKPADLPKPKPEVDLVGLMFAG